MLSHKRLAQDGHPCYQSPKSLLFGEPSSVIRPQGKAGFNCHEILLDLGRAPNAGDITPLSHARGRKSILNAWAVARKPKKLNSFVSCSDCRNWNPEVDRQWPQYEPCENCVVAMIAIKK
ncbi:hypothetical protein V2G26_012481 [Clonostachys chloroleuca]